MPATKGGDITLTIDSKIQLILEQALEKAMQEQQAKGVTGLVMNAKTSEILAISSKPSFDLNNIPRDDLTTLFDQSKIKAITDVYEPGSTLKSSLSRRHWKRAWSVKMTDFTARVLALSMG